MKTDTIVEKFKCDPYQGVVGLVLSIRKKGYQITKIDRKNDNVTVTYKKVVAT